MAIEAGALGPEALKIVGKPRLGKSHPALAADEEEIAPLEEFEGDEGERFRPFGGDGATCVILRRRP